MNLGDACNVNYGVYLNKLGIFNQQSVDQAYQYLISNNCPQAASGLTPPPGYTPAPQPSVTTTIKQWFNFNDPLPNDCAGLQAAYQKAVATGDYATAMEAAGKISLLDSTTCSVPGVNPPAGGFSCDVVYRIYADKSGVFNEDAKAKAYASLVANNCPQVSAGSGPAPFDCAAAQAAYIKAVQSGQNAGDLYHSLIINGCSVPSTASYCIPLQQQFQAYYNAKDASGMLATIVKMQYANCTQPGPTQWNYATNQPVYPETPQQIACDQLQAQYVEVSGMHGDTSSIVASMCTNNCTMPAGVNCGPPVNPCTGSQSLTLADYLLNLPIKGLEQDPILAILISVAGVATGTIIGYVLIPEFMGKMYVRVPIIAGGVYGGLIANGILSNYGFVKNAEKYGIVFGTIVTGLGAFAGIYQSIHDSTEGFLKTELGSTFGEIVYKVGEGVISAGLFPIYDAVFGDKTFTTAGYDKAKCEADCGNPSYSSMQRKLCKFGARLDLKF